MPKKISEAVRQQCFRLFNEDKLTIKEITEVLGISKASVDILKKEWKLKKNSVTIIQQAETGNNITQTMDTLIDGVEFKYIKDKFKYIIEELYAIDTSVIEINKLKHKSISLNIERLDKMTRSLTSYAVFLGNYQPRVIDSGDTTDTMAVVVSKEYYDMLTDEEIAELEERNLKEVRNG